MLGASAVPWSSLLWCEVPGGAGVAVPAGSCCPRLSGKTGRSHGHTVTMDPLCVPGAAGWELLGVLC